MTIDISLEIDTTGLSPANRKKETHTLPYEGLPRLIVPQFGAYYAQSLRVWKVSGPLLREELVRGEGFLCCEMMERSTREVGMEIAAVVLILDTSAQAVFEIEYQALGGWSNPNVYRLRELLKSIGGGSGSALDWKNIIKPLKFNPKLHHLHDALDLFGMEYVRDAVQRVVAAVRLQDRHGHIQLHEAIRDKLSRIDLTKEGLDWSKVTRVAQRAEVGLLQAQEAGDRLRQVAQEVRLLANEGLTHAGWHTPLLAKSFKNATLLKTMRMRSLSGQGLIKMPKVLGNLALWLDASQPGKAQNGGIVHDSADPEGRKFLCTAPVLGQGLEAKWDLSQSGLTLHAGPTLKIDQEVTVIAVTQPPAQAGWGWCESVQILGGSRGELRLNLSSNENDHGWRWTQDRETILRHPCGVNAVAGDRLSILTASFDHRKTYALSNDPAPNEDLLDREAELGFTEGNAPVAWDVLSVGSSSSGFLKEVIVFTRRLSAWELELVVEWMNLKRGIRTCLAENPRFLAGLKGFSSELEQRGDGLKTEGCAWIRHPVLPSGAFDLIDWDAIVKYIPQGQSALGWRCASEKVVWSQRQPLLDAYVQHRLQVEFYQHPSHRSSLAVRYGGQLIAGTKVQSDDSHFTYTWDFAAARHAEKLEIVCIPNQGDAIGAITEVRLHRHHSN